MYSFDSNNFSTLQHSNDFPLLSFISLMLEWTIFIESTVVYRRIKFFIWWPFGLYARNFRRIQATNLYCLCTLRFKRWYSFGYKKNLRSFIFISSRVPGPCWPIALSFSMHSSRKTLWMLFSSISWKMILAFKKTVDFSPNFKKMLAFINFLIQWLITLHTVSQESNYDILEHSTTMNIFSWHLWIDLRWWVLWNWLTEIHAVEAKSFVVNVIIVISFLLDLKNIKDTFNIVVGFPALFIISTIKIQSVSKFQNF